MAALMANEALAKASSFLMQAHSLDNNIPDMAQLMHCDAFNELTVSGVETNSYPGLEFKTPELAPLKIKLIPTELKERMRELQCSCQMGIFKEINRAWLSIDNEIYLWTLGESNDIAYFDGLKEMILTAAIVKPKPGIFQSHINHLLCLATPVEVVLLGITQSREQVPLNSINNDTTTYNDLHILPEPLFSISVDNDVVTSIRGTQAGRIFFGGRNGRLYEIDYQGDYSWFGKRSVWKTNHSSSLSSYLIPKFVSSYISSEDPILQICIDESRQCLYTRSFHSNIELFYLGKDGNRTSKVAYTWHEDNVKKIVNLPKSIDVSKLSSIKHMCCIPFSDSDKVHLMAITQTGVRLYYTSKSLTETSNHPTSSPNTLTLIHVQLPPTFTNYQSNLSPPPFIFENMNQIHFCQGTSFMTSSNQSQKKGDVLWVLSNDLFPFTRHISESYDCIQLAGQVWAIAELNSETNSASKLTLNHIQSDCLSRKTHFKESQWRELPPRVNEIYTANKKFAILTSLGICLATKLTLTDRLHHLLSVFSVESDQVNAYFISLQDQAMVNCLHLMTSNEHAHQQVSTFALKAYHLYKWRSYNCSNQLDQSSLTPRNKSINSNETKTVSLDTSPTSPYLPITSSNHRSLYLFTSRILRPVWLKSIVVPVLQKNSKTTFLASRLNSEELFSVLQKCVSLKTLLQNNPSLLASSFSSQSFNQGTNNCSSKNLLFSDQQCMNVSFLAKRNKPVKEAAEIDETSSLKDLEFLIDVSSQLLHLWSLLSDHQFHLIASKLSPEKQQKLVGSTFSQLIFEDQEISKSLVASLIELYMEDHSAIDVITDRLQEHSSIFYTFMDQALTKANEYINAAKVASSSADKERFVELAVKHYRMIFLSSQPPFVNHPYSATNFSLADLSTICSKLVSVSAYTGLVQLVLLACSSRDPNNLALHYYFKSKPLDDIIGESHYRYRLNCYECILESLNHLLSISGYIIGQVNKSEASCKKIADVQINEVVESIEKCDDCFCQFVLFKWLIDNNRSDKLLELRSLHIEKFLKLESMVDETDDQTNQNHLHQQHLIYQKSMLDLLARYYMKQSEFIQAAKILDSLALKHGNHIDLTDRLNLMTRASLCLQSSTSVSPMSEGGHFLHEVQDKVEVIRLQLEVLNEMERLSSKETDFHHAIYLLNSKLYDVSELYAIFATPYDLSKCKLSIIRCSGHLDAQLVQKLWQEVFDKELVKTAGQKTEERMELFISFVVGLGKIHRDSINYFPIDFLVRSLEQTSVMQGFYKLDVSCMSKALLEVGVDIIPLHDVYASLYKEKTNFWKNYSRQFHLAEVDAKLIVSFIDGHKDHTNSVLSFEKRGTINKLLASISCYLVDLHSEVHEQGPLVGCLEQMQISLERLQNPVYEF